MTNQKQSTQGLSYDAAKNVVNAIFDAGCIVDKAGNVEHLNTSARELFFENKDVFDNSGGVNDTLDLESIAGVEFSNLVFYMNADDVDASTARLFKKHCVSKTDTGRLLSLDLSILPIDSARGESYLLIAKNENDISQSDEVQRLKINLAHMSRLTVMGELAAGIAHEINQPLTAIASYAIASKNFIHKETSQGLQKAIDAQEKIHSQVVRATEVTGRLRDFVKQRISHREKISLYEVIKEAVELATIDHRSTKHQIITHFSDNMRPIVFVDPIQIQQVLLNLISNSIEAMESKTEGFITIKCQLYSRDKVEVSVIDDGVGVDQEISEQLFTPFFSTKSKGTGIGLSICQTIVRAHGGTIYYKILPSSGMEFSFLLPFESLQA